MIVDVGGGLLPLAGAHNLDPVSGAGVWKRRLQDGIPVKSGEVEMVRASHVLEHISASERIGCFNEVWRALKPGGLFVVVVPLMPSWQAMADPTHVSFFVKQSFWYFTGEWSYGADYGIRPWTWAEEGYRVRDGWEATARLRKPAASLEELAWTAGKGRR